jgi:hypothetical protein
MIVITHTSTVVGENELLAARHGAALRETSIRDYGVTPGRVSFLGQGDKYCQIQFRPTRDRARLYQWLEFIGAQVVAVEKDDIPFLVGSKVMALSLQQNWHAIAPSLSQLELGEVFDAIENAARIVLTAQPASGDDSNSKYVRSQQERITVDAMRAAGISVPDSDTGRDRHRAAVEQARQAAEDRLYQQWTEDPETPLIDPFPYRDRVGDY